MEQMELVRELPQDDGVFGQLYGPFGVLATVEDDWRSNARGVSCIPAGRYRLERTVYYKHGYETFEVTDVPGRSRILIHPANTEEDVKGCIGVGMRWGTLKVADEDDPEHTRKIKRSVVASRQAFDKFMAALANTDEAHLIITWPLGFIP